MTSGFGSMTFFTAVFAASAMDGEALASGPDCWSAGFWHPATSAPKEKADSEMQQDGDSSNPPTGWNSLFFKHTPTCYEVKLTCANSKRRFRPNLVSITDSVPLELYRFGFDWKNPILMSAIRTLPNREVSGKSTN